MPSGSCKALLAVKGREMPEPSPATHPPGAEQRTGAFSSIEDAIEDIRRGRMVVVCDDESREKRSPDGRHELYPRSRIAWLRGPIGATPKVR